MRRLWLLLCCAALLPAATAPSAGVTQHMVLLEPTEGQLVVRESFIVQNSGDSPFVDAKNGTVRVFVPDAGVSSLLVTAMAQGQAAVNLKPSPTGLGQVYKVDFPVPPGETRFDFSYSMPFKNPGKFSGKVLHRDGAVNLVVPAGVSLKGDGVEPIGMEPQTNSRVPARWRRRRPPSRRVRAPHSMRSRRGSTAACTPFWACRSASSPSVLCCSTGWALPLRSACPNLNAAADRPTLRVEPRRASCSNRSYPFPGGQSD